MTSELIVTGSPVNEAGEEITGAEPLSGTDTAGVVVKSYNPDVSVENTVRRSAVLWSVNLTQRSPQRRYISETMAEQNVQQMASNTPREKLDPMLRFASL